jgi:hypothetical protein
MSDTKVLTTLIEVLEPLTSEDRQRNVRAAMTYLGETVKSSPGKPNDGADKGSDDNDYEGFSEAGRRWMAENKVSPDQLDRVFHLKADGTFDLLNAPGTYKKEQTLNTYTLTGLGTYLANGERAFDDATARKFCVKIGCYDSANHSYTIKGNKGGEFSGDKKGYTITNIGLKRGAELVKELAGSAS